MILPIRCFTCNRVICDGKVFIFEKSRYNNEDKEILQNKLANLIKYFELFIQQNQLDKDTIHLVHTPRKLKNEKLQQYHNLILNIDSQDSKDSKDSQDSQDSQDSKDEISKSSDFDLLNLLSVDKICCRRMFLGYVNMIDKII
jgi:DNA-directed RNA polymerase subunit N (RpoN/RPB10)